MARRITNHRESLARPVARGISRTIALGIAACIAVGAFAVVETVPAQAQVPMDSGTTVMGRPAVTAKQLADYYYSKKGRDFARIPTLDGDVERLAEIFISEGTKDGVRGDIAFMQSMLETGWLEFKDYGQIRPDFNNFAGMFAYDGRPIGTTCAAEEAEEAAGGLKSRCFDSPEIGVRAQIHKLRSYADSSVANVSGRLGYAPSYSRGKAPFWEQFGGASGIAIWATAPDYGTYILDKMYFPMLSRLGVTLPCQPAGANGAGTVGEGYWVVTANGTARSFGSATSLGTAGTDGVVDVAGAPGGAWLATAEGAVRRTGSAPDHGSLAGARIGASVVAIVPTAPGDGYWLVTADGSVYPFGAARDVGTLGREVLRSPVIDAEATVDGQGLWLLLADGAVRPIGTASDYGSPTAATRQVVAFSRTASGAGYVMVTASGRVVAFGDAIRRGDLTGCGFGPVIDIDATSSGDGYWITTESGRVFAFGAARYHGAPSRLDDVVAFAPVA